MLTILIAFAGGYVAATPTGKKLINKIGDAAFGTIKQTVDKAVNKYKAQGDKSDELSKVSTPAEQ